MELSARIYHSFLQHMSVTVRGQQLKQLSHVPVEHRSIFLYHYFLNLCVRAYRKSLSCNHPSQCQVSAHT